MAMTKTSVVFFYVTPKGFIFRFMLSIHQYKKSYSGRTILQIDSLQLSPGIYWLRAENGAGKTTLFRSIAGLIPFEGNIEANGIRLRQQRKAYTTIVSFAEAEPVYPGFLSGSELLQFYLQTKGGDAKKMQYLAKCLMVESYLPCQVATYSSGMLKKLSLLLAFTGKPVWILLDEPFITLDTEAVEALQVVITQQHHSGVSFLISSHQELALKTPYHSLQIRQQTIHQQPYVAGA